VNFLADENIDRQIVERLRQNGYSVHFVAEMDPGISDENVLNTENLTAAVLITADKDFGDIVYRQRRDFAGIVLIRLGGLAPDEKASIVAAVVARHEAEIEGAFTVVSARVVRIRRRRG
jgi:predicted nuclease of predicted toxin-antitoxin system